MARIETHEIIKDFIHVGIPENQAEALVAKFVIKDEFRDLATKTDIAELRAATKNDLKIGLLELRTELKTDIAELKTDVAAIKTELKWGMYALAAILGLLIKITFFSNH